MPKNRHAVALGKLGGVARAAALTPEQLSDIGRKAGHVGGKARAQKLSKGKRSAIARKAAAARWGAKRPPGSEKKTP
jgi:general stress protein YciG